MAGPRTRDAHEAWSPADRTPRQRRNDRVQVVGSLVLLALLLLAVGLWIL